MAKYNFGRLGPDRFEEMLKALLEQRLRITGKLIQFGDGPDGAREATWRQPPSHPQWIAPALAQKKAKKVGREWVFQAKYQASERSGAHTADLLEDELEKIFTKHRVPCHTYILVTNLSLTGGRHRGSRDRVEQIVERWRPKIDDIRVWDACDLSAMLDADPAVRQTFLDAILPGDILAALLQDYQGTRARVRKILRGYLDALVDPTGAAAAARTTEAGDDSERPLQIKDVYIDLTLETSAKRVARDVIRSAIADSSRLTFGTRDPKRGDEDIDAPPIPASLALMTPRSYATLLLAGPGYGKSTLCQFATLYHAARVVGSLELLASLRNALSLPELVTWQAVEANAAPRIPFRIELRRYAEWLNDTPPDGAGVARFIAERIVRPLVEGQLDAEDIFSLVEDNPTLLILDGLDEVPNPDSRKSIVEHLTAFLNRVRHGSQSDIQVLLSSRPQGYNQEFLTFEPTTWTIQDLKPELLWRYCDVWLAQRVGDPLERTDARRRLEIALASTEVSRLATTLLQTTVMLSIARSKKDIPHERTSLFRRFVDVAFQREKEKSAHVREYEPELRRLHAETAYRIHRQMEAGGPDGLADEDFRGIALRTWEAFRGDQLQDVKLTATVDHIIQAAQDRLVFLKGQGEQQSQIGFLLASFREYFAADHLRSDERADRNRVFDALLERDAHWENVLRFYAGSQEPAVHVDWIDRLAESNTSSSPALVVRTIRQRRLLLKLLPEFGGLQRKSFQRAVDEVFAEDTLWSWGEDQWVASLVNDMRSGIARPLVLNRLEQALARDDAGIFASALSLTAQLTADTGIDNGTLELIRGRLDTGWVRDQVVQALANGDCPELFAAIGPADIIRNADGWSFGNDDAIHSMPRSMIAQLTMAWGRDWYESRTGWDTSPEDSRRNPWPVISPPIGCAIRIRDGLHAHISSLLFGGGHIHPEFEGLVSGFGEPYRSIGRALIAALEHHDDRDANEACIATLRSLPDQTTVTEWCRHAGLAEPRPNALSEIDRDEQWSVRLIALRSLAATFKSTADLLSSVEDEAMPTGYSENWLFGLVHPARWIELVASGLVSAPAEAAVRSSLFGRLALAVPSRLSVFDTLSREQRPKDRVPISPLIPIFARESTTTNWEWILRGILEDDSGRDEGDDVIQIATTIKQVPLETVPDGAASAFMRNLLLRYRPADVAEIVTLHTRATALGFFHRAPKTAFINIARFGTPASDDLTTWLVIRGGVDRSERDVSSALLRLSLSAAANPHRRMRAIMELDCPVTQEELRQWSSPDFWQNPAATQSIARPIAHRLTSKGFDGGEDSYLEGIYAIISGRASFPQILVNAAIARAIALQASKTELQDRTWQKDVRSSAVRIGA